MRSNGSAPKGIKINQRHLRLREKLWPATDFENVVWNRKTNDGWTTIPRILPLILRLFTVLDNGKASANANPSKVYIDLWCRANDTGFVDVTNEDECIYSSGYSKRRKRTWQEHIKCLEDLGFVKTAKKGFNEIGYVLIIDPYLAAEQLRKQGRVTDDGWWNTFVARVAATGATLPSEKRKKADAKVKTKPKAKRKSKKGSRGNT